MRYFVGTRRRMVDGGDDAKTAQSAAGKAGRAAHPWREADGEH